MEIFQKYLFFNFEMFILYVELSCHSVVQVSFCIEINELLVIVMLLSVQFVIVVIILVLEIEPWGLWPELPP